MSCALGVCGGGMVTCFPQSFLNCFCSSAVVTMFIFNSSNAGKSSRLTSQTLQLRDSYVWWFLLKCKRDNACFLPSSVLVFLVSFYIKSEHENGNLVWWGSPCLLLPFNQLCRPNRTKTVFPNWPISISNNGVTIHFNSTQVNFVHLWIVLVTAAAMAHSASPHISRNHLNDPNGE